MMFRVQGHTRVVMVTHTRVPAHARCHGVSCVPIVYAVHVHVRCQGFMFNVQWPPASARFARELAALAPAPLRGANTCYHDNTHVQRVLTGGKYIPRRSELQNMY